MQTKEVKLPKAFGKSVEVELENGRTLRIEKWSVRKAASLTGRISKIVGGLFSSLERKQVSEYEEALAQAEKAGIKPGEDGFPEPEDFAESSVSDLISYLPEIIESAISDVVELVADSLHTRDGSQVVTPDEVLDDFTFEQDLPEVLSKIIELNISDKSLGKWKKVMKAIGVAG